MLSLCKSFVSQLPDENGKVAKATYMNRSVEALKEESVNVDTFAEQVFETPELVSDFKQYKEAFQKERDIEIDDTFETASSAIKRRFAGTMTTIKLDRNFDINIHGGEQYIERGYDEERGMYYYQLFFKEEKWSMAEENKIILYQDDDEVTRVSVRFADEDLWLTQNQLAEIYCTTKQNISQHIDNILKDGELDPNRTVKDFLTVRQEGKRQVQRSVLHYNLDMVIALGYRVQSQVATRFRRWATQRLHEYIQKGFAMDDERLKQGGNRYFRELLQRIRDIRSSERNFYQQVTDIYATATDYDPRDEMTKMFFATVQNKLHYAVHENTAAEVIYNRVDNEKPFVGMTNFKGNYVTKDDVKIAKNYLSEIELQRLSLLVSGFLDFAEFQALEMNPMTMKDWIEALDNQIIAHKRKVLIGKGNISHKQAIEKAEKEFEIYRKREMELLESDFDKEIKKLKNKNDNNPN